VCGPDSTNPESSIGEWKLTKSGGTETTVDLDQDVICNCPLLKVKVEEGSELACTTPLEAGDNYYSLQEPNTCIVVCDGIFATTLTCEKDPKTDGGSTSWFSSYNDVHDLVTDSCISCHEGSLDAECTSPSTTTNEEATTETAETTETP